MPPKAKMPAPIDRPLSRAYLREFSGWSTAYPPGASQPTSLRKMENMLINREGSIRVRPGLRRFYPRVAGQLPNVGTFEPFYLNDGRKAWLFAVRDMGAVTFQAMTTVPASSDPFEMEAFALDHPSIAFDLSVSGTPSFTLATTYVKYLQIDNKIIALSNAGEPLIVFHVGATKKVLNLETITYPQPDGIVASAPAVYQPTYTWAANVNGEQEVDPPAVAQGHYPNTLISSDPALNTYNYGFFFTYSNELGESTASDVRLVKAQRGWGAWSTDGLTGIDPTYAPGPNAGSPAPNVNQFGDMLIVAVGETAAAGYNSALAQGATSINIYMFTWSDQDSVPVEAGLVGTLPMAAGMTPGMDGFIRVTPVTTFQSTVPLPNAVNRYNSTTPSKATNGIVASDRMVLVGDPTAAAVIRWTTNEQGNYLNFSPGKGGGYKTLTSGNMQVTAAVKLWQNPQSADTLTILNLGTDSYSTSYYMAPAQVASQSDATNIMGFEETTATPGTTSPYGCEVANNTLYHPLDHELMKSTASNYNINHKSMTDLIANKWKALEDKQKIVSSVHDNRIYYLVNNPEGAAVPDHCNGNEVWVLDLAAEGGSWSRWLTPGVSLKRVELGGQSMMALVQPTGFYAFDPTYIYDDVPGAGTSVVPVNIPWSLETNTQGANRAHDAWAHLQQVGISLGNFFGRVRWGVKGWDLHGRKVEIEKITSAGDQLPDDKLPFDLEDQLRVARDMKEWFFFASSVESTEFPGPEQSAGQITLVQYRYTPVSVNVGYEHGSVETFEYGRDVAVVTSNTDNGVPTPVNDQRRM